MYIKKETAINDVIERLGGFANLILHQLSILEKFLSIDYADIPDELSKEVVINEEKADLLEIKLSDKIVRIIVLHQPVASDLRKLMACFRIVMNLERIGDSVMNILKFYRKIRDAHTFNSLREVILNMLSASKEMVEKSILSFINNDKEYAVWTIRNDDVVDKMNHKLIHASISKSKLPVETEDLLLSLIHINSIISNLERIADHATNIAEASIYAMEGKDVRHQHEDED
jgi:phosphate transport system protein